MFSLICFTIETNHYILFGPQYKTQRSVVELKNTLNRIRCQQSDQLYLTRHKLTS